MENLRKEPVSKSLLVKVLQWFYLVLVFGIALILVWNKQIPYLSDYNIPDSLKYIAGGALIFYCFILTISFFTQNTNLLILALVFIFFTTIGALALLLISLPNAGAVVNGQLPSCAKSISLCSLKEGIIVGSAVLLAISVPTLILNFITIIGAVKAIAATD